MPCIANAPGSVFGRRSSIDAPIQSGRVRTESRVGGGGAELLKGAPELPEVVGQFVHVGGRGGITLEHGDGDGLLVHIEAKEEC